MSPFWEDGSPEGRAQFLSKAKKERRYPYPHNDGQMHYEGCWEDRGHHNCAVARVRELLLELADAERRST